MSKLYSAEEVKGELERALNIFKSRLPKRQTKMLVSDWAEKNRILPNGLTSKPGPFRFIESFPMKEIADCLSESSTVREVALMKGAQLGGTVAVIENFIGYIISQAPGPTLAITGDKDMADSWMEKRVDPMIESCGLRPLIFSQVKKRHNRDTGDTKDSKAFPGGFLKAIGPNSGSKLRSDAIQYLLLDEEDAYPQEVQGEGDPVALAIRRTDTFESTRKILHISTPLIKNTSRIEAAYLDGDQRRFYVPCRKCGHFQALEWSGICYEKDEKGQLVWDSVGYKCEGPGCKEVWKNSDKAWFLERGEWRPTAKAKKRDYQSYHLSSLYASPGTRSWESIAEEFVGCNGDTGKLRAFINTVLGQTWEERGEAPKWERIMLKSRGVYQSGALPKDHRALVVTLGADIQRDRIECEVIAWGPGKRSWSLDYFVCPGDTTNVDGPAWAAFRMILEREHAGRPITMALVDAGYNTSQVYQFCETYPSGVYPVMSEPFNSQGKNIFTMRDIPGYATKRVNIQSGQLKSEIYSYLGHDSVDLNGACKFPEDYPEEFFKQLTAESLVSEKMKSGATRISWKKSRERNEALDCRVYGLAALYVLNEVVKGDLQLEEMPWDEFWAYLEKIS